MHAAGVLVVPLRQQAHNFKLLRAVVVAAGMLVLRKKDVSGKQRSGEAPGDHDSPGSQVMAKVSLTQSFGIIGILIF